MRGSGTPAFVIVVVEGPSAAGKTTWAAAQEPNAVLAELGPVTPPSGLSVTGLARFWTDVNCGRWQEAVRIEAERRLTVCDTDPLKLHYAYCLARIGAARWEHFEAGVAHTTEAICAGRLGLADLMLVRIPDDESLRRQRSSDTMRERHNFDLHRRLSPSLRDWYDSLAQLDPGRVRWDYPEEMPSHVVRERYDVNLFRAWMERLLRPLRER